MIPSVGRVGRERQEEHKSEVLLGYIESLKTLPLPLMKQTPQNSDKTKQNLLHSVAVSRIS